MSYLSGDESGAYLSGDIVGEIVGAVARGKGISPHRGPMHPMHPMHPAHPAHPANMTHPAHHPHHVHPHAAHAYPHGYNPTVVEYEPFSPRKTRKSQVGVPLGVVKSGFTIEFVTQPQKPFRPERLIIPSNLGGFYTLADFKVGNTSQFVSSAGEIPALAYSEQAVGVEILSDTAYISQFLVLSAHNVSATSQLFSAGFFGTSVE